MGWFAQASETPSPIAQYIRGLRRLREMEHLKIAFQVPIAGHLHSCEQSA
jgi:hypothetical protein